MYGWIIFFSVLHLNCFLFKSVYDCIIPLSPTPTFLFSRGDGQHTVIWKILIIRIWLRSLNPWPMIWLRHCTCLSRIFKGSSSMPLQLLLLLLNCIQLLHICQMEQSRSGQISYKRIPDLVVVLVPHPSLNPQKSETSFGSHHPCVFGFCARPITANEPNIQDINLSPNISMDIRFGYITICMGICQICMYCSVISHLSRVDLWLQTLNHTQTYNNTLISLFTQSLKRIIILYSEKLFHHEDLIFFYN